MGRNTRMEQDLELISIIVPIYNVELYIERCIDSIINQTYKNLEIILIDDGSTDRSGEICDIYGKTDTRIKVIHQKNAGPAVARNYGLNIARGNYIGFVDSDDFIATDMYESLYNYMKNGVDITCCGSQNISPRNKTVAYKTKGVASFNTEEALSELLRRNFICFSACDKLFKKELIKDIRFPTGRLCEDLPFTYQAIKKSNGVVNIGAVKYFYCYRQDSRSRADFSVRRMDYVYFARDIYIDINLNFPQLSKAAEMLYFQNTYYIINQIENSSDRNRYIEELKRFKKMLRNMVIQIVLNPYLSKKEKFMYLRVIKTRTGK